MDIEQLSTTAPHERAQVWEIDTQHASAGFRVRHLMVSHVRGELGPVTGTVWLDEEDVRRSIRVGRFYAPSAAAEGPASDRPRLRGGATL